MTSTPDPRPDVYDMLGVHQVFRDTFAAGPALVDAVGADDVARRALLANFYDNILRFLHVHHAGEDELLFARLRERCTEAERATVDRVAAQHRDVDDLVAASEAALGDWQSRESGAQTRTGSVLAELGQRLVEHLDTEEQEILPMCAEYMSVAEWAELPGHGMRSFDGDKLWLILGLIRQRMSQAQRDNMLSNMPPPLVEMWTGFGEGAFGNLIAEVGAPLG